MKLVPSCASSTPLIHRHEQCGSHSAPQCSYGGRQQWWVAALRLCQVDAHHGPAVGMDDWITATASTGSQDARGSEAGSCQCGHVPPHPRRRAGHHLRGERVRCHDASVVRGLHCVLRYIYNRRGGGVRVASRRSLATRFICTRPPSPLPPGPAARARAPAGPRSSL